MDDAKQFEQWYSSKGYDESLYEAFYECYLYGQQLSIPERGTRLTDDELVRAMAELWVSEGGDGAGFELYWERIRNAVNAVIEETSYGG